MASPTQWIWVWANSRSWWWTGKPGVLQSMGLQRVRHDWANELNWALKVGRNAIILEDTKLRALSWYEFHTKMRSPEYISGLGLDAWEGRRLGFPQGTSEKNSCLGTLIALSSRRAWDSSGGHRRPCRSKIYTELQHTLGNSEGQRSLLFCSPWGRKESNTT